ncbi:efflux RND transporter periplasmic adaptor subunit [Chromatiaceae bacterium AAb-1]|nr:efflux RND transporter periplasmic adaptor subunit [Chromatiaceae bacterium AAb-1]
MKHIVIISAVIASVAVYGVTAQTQHHEHHHAAESKQQQHTGHSQSQHHDHHHAAEPEPQEHNHDTGHQHHAVEAAHQHQEEHLHHGHDPQAEPGVISSLTSPDSTPVYVCPMHPQIKQHQPGSCPICGMDLVLQKPAAASYNSTNHSVTVSGNMQQALGIRTATVSHRTLQTNIDTLAQVQYPEDAIHHSHIRAQGWIEQLYVRTSGAQVKAGDKLFSYYAPELVVAQDDYLQAWSIRHSPNGKNLLQRSETRLRLLGLTTADISYLQQHQQSQHRITAYAQHSGIVTALNVRDGMYIQPGDTLLEITNLSKVWLIAEVTEAQKDQVYKGMKAQVTLAPSQQSISTAVDYLYPELDKQSRTLKARLLLDNPQQALHPNSLVPVQLLMAPKPHALAIPRDAVLLSHKGSRVIVRHDEHFSVRQIETGIQADGYTEVLSGLDAGEEVVISGQFLLDAEASLSQLPASSAAAQQHQH